jgi:hypothetical protein
MHPFSSAVSYDLCNCPRLVAYLFPFKLSMLVLVCLLQSHIYFTPQFITHLALAIILEYSHQVVHETITAAEFESSLCYYVGLEAMKTVREKVQREFSLFTEFTESFSADELNKIFLKNHSDIQINLLSLCI